VKRTSFGIRTATDVYGNPATRIRRARRLITTGMAEKLSYMKRGVKKRIGEGRWEILWGRHVGVEPRLNCPDGRDPGAATAWLGKPLVQRERTALTYRIGWEPGFVFSAIYLASPFPARLQEERRGF